jgi:pilus assembly protein Flp/PilA
LRAFQASADTAVAHPLPFVGSSRGQRSSRGSHSEHSIARHERAPEETDMVLSIITRLQSIVRREEGQDLLEYALLVALIALVAVGAITLAGKNVNTIFGNIASQLVTPAS